VQVYVWVWPGVGHGVSGDFSSYFPTREWGRLKTGSPFDTSSSEHSAFVTRLDLFWFPHWFVKILCSWVWFISFTRCWFILSEEVDLDSSRKVDCDSGDRQTLVCKEYLFSRKVFSTNLQFLIFWHGTEDRRPEVFVYWKFLVILFAEPSHDLTRKYHGFLTKQVAFQPLSQPWGIVAEPSVVSSHFLCNTMWAKKISNQ